MNRKTTSWLLVVALGLFAFIWFVERDMITSGEVADRRDRLLPRLVRDRVTEIAIERGDERIELRRAAAEGEDDEPKWSLAEPVEADADADAVAALLGALEWAEPEQRLEDVSAEDRRRFGLESPHLVVRFEVANETQSLRLGGEASTGAGYYAALDEDGAAFVVGRDVYEAIDHDASHFRSKAVFGGELPDPSTLSVEGPGGVFSAAQGDRGYSLTAPVAMRARGSKIDAAIDALRGLEATRFVAEALGDAPGNGLDEPYLRVKLELEGADPKELRVGAPCAEQEGERHARLDDGPVVCIGETAIAPLLVDPLELRDLRPVTARDLDVKGLVLERGGERIEVREDDGELEYTLRRGGREREGSTSEEAFHRWLRAMRAAEATSVVALEGGSAKRLGLERPRATLRLRLRGEEDGEEVLRIGAVSADGLYVQRGDEPNALVLPAAADAAFEVAAHRLADLSLVTESPERLVSIRIAGSERQELLTVREGEWAVTEPVEVRADASRAADLARRLAALEADRFVADEAAPEHGLASPRFVVTSRFEGSLAGEPDDDHGHDHDHGEEAAAEAREHVLRVGATASGGAYASLDDDPAVFVLPASVVELLERPLADPRALSTSEPQIEAIRVVSKGKEVSITREGGAFLAQTGPADAERTRGLLDRLSSLLATAVVGYGEPPAEAKLASPRARIVVRRAENAPAPREAVLLVGAEHGEGDARRVFVKREDLAVTFEVAGALVDGILEYRP